MENLLTVDGTEKIIGGNIAQSSVPAKMDIKKMEFPASQMAAPR